MGDICVRADAIEKRYFRATRERARDFAAVEAASLSLRSGEVSVLMGRSGSGKTTLLSMLSGLLAPTTGVVEFRGTDLYALTDAERARVRRDSFGIIAQGPSLIADLTAGENVLMGAGLGRGADVAMRARADELLRRLSVDELTQSWPSSLSGGEARRVAIARALVATPEVVFADEPTADLDDESTACVLSLLREVADAGAAVLLVTHERQATEVADSLWRMDAGTLTQVDAGDAAP